MCTEEKKLAKRAYDKARRESNPEKEAARKKIWYENNTDKIALSNRRWYAANKERDAIRSKAWRTANPEKKSDSLRRWKSGNTGKVNSSHAKRRAVKLQAIPCWADGDKIAKVYESARIQTEDTGISHHVDHIVPLQSKIVCGLHCEFNLRAIPSSANVSKSNRHWPDMP